MKNFLATLGIFLMLPFSTMAATPASIVDENTDILLNLDPSKMDEDIKYFYHYLLDQIAQYGADPLELYLLDSLSKAKLALSLNLGANFSGEDAAGFIEMTQAEFDEIISQYSPTPSEVNPGFYVHEGSNSVFTYYQGQFITTDSEEQLASIISSTATKLSENADYKKTIEKLTNGGFFTFYGQIEPLIESLLGGQLSTNVILNAAISEGATIKQTSTGFNLESYSILDPVKVAANGMDFSKNGDLILHKLMPNQSPIYFYNSKSISNIKLLTEDVLYDEIKKEIERELNIDITDLLTVLEGETAVLVQNNGEIIPAITFMADVKTNKTKVKTAIDKSLDQYWNAILADADQVNDQITVARETVKIAGENVDQFVVKFKIEANKNPYAPKPSEELLTFKITVGITGDNALLFSTNKNIVKDYGTGLSDNKDIKTLTDKMPSGVLYLSPKNLNGYIQNVLTTIESLTPENIIDLSEAKAIVEKVLAPWGTITSTIDFSNTEFTSNLSVNIDLPLAVKTYNKALFAGDFLQDVELVGNATKDYEDVHNKEWFSDDVYYLSTKGVINGYSDGEFKPTQSINRAEFTKLIVEVLEKNGYIDSQYSYDLNLGQSLTDIEEYSWYEQPVGKAYRAGLINGYNDKTFHPGGNISRGEAAQIITNVLAKYDITAVPNGLIKAEDLQISDWFDDVKASDWFYKAAQRVVFEGIMTGKTPKTFAPNDNLNRAEAAKIIRNLLDLLENSDL